MVIQIDKLNQINDLIKNHRVIIVGEIHGVKQNTEVVLELVNFLKKTHELIVGLEYPQSVIDSPQSVDQIYYKDGRYSPYHKEMIKIIKDNGIEVFGFDMSGDQIKEQENQKIDWRDQKMAENINKKIAGVSQNKKILLVSGDIHYQTLEQSFMYPDQAGDLKPTSFLPMAAQINTPSILAIHIRYLSGIFYNFRLKEMPTITANKETSFRENDDLIEIDIQEAVPTIE